MPLATAPEVDLVLVALTPLLLLHFLNRSNTSSLGNLPLILEANIALLCRPRVRSSLGVKEKMESLDTAIASLYYLLLLLLLLQINLV